MSALASSQPRRDPAIEGTRAVAASLVFVFHIVSALARVRPDVVAGAPRTATSQFGHFGVAIFFVVSGFVLYRPWVRAQVQGEGSPALGRYLIRRFGRIYPAYWLAALAYFLWLSMSPPRNLGEWAEYLLLLQNYRAGGALAGLGVAWTLVIEVSFYLVVPCIALACRSGAIATPLRRHWIAVGTLFVLGHATRIAALGVEPGSRGSWQPWRDPSTWLPGFVDWFALGMALALVGVTAEVGRSGPRNLVVRYATPIQFAGAGVFAVAHLGLPAGTGAVYTDGQYLLRNGVVPLAAAMVIAPILLGAPAASTRALASRPMVWLGTISYGIYLWQIPVLRGLRTLIENGDLPASPLRLIALAIPATVLIATASYYVVERRIMRRLDR